MEQLVGLMRYVGGDYDDPQTFDKLREALGGCERPLHYLAIPPSLFATVVEHIGNAGLAERRARRRREAVRARPRVGAGAQPRAAAGLPRGARLPHRPLPRQGAGREPPLLPLRQRVPRADLEPRPRQPDPDHDGRGLRRRDARRVLRGRRRDPRRDPEPPLPGAHAAGDGPVQRLARRRACATRRRASCAAMRALRAGRRRARPVPRLPRDRRRRRPTRTVETYAALRLHVDTWRWADVPILVRAGKCLPVKATEIVVELKRPPETALPDAAPARQPRCASRSTPTSRSGIEVQARRADAEDFEVEDVELLAMRQTAAPGPALPAAADRRAARASTTCSRARTTIEEAWRIVEPILGDATPVHLVRAGQLGPGGGRPP